MAVEGDAPRIRRTLLGQSATSTGSAPAPATVTAPVAAPPEGIGEEALRDRVVSRLRQLLSDVIGLPVGKIDAQTPLTDYGIDSIVVTRLNRKLAAVFPDLPRTLLYDFNALDALASTSSGRTGRGAWTGRGRRRPGRPLRHRGRRPPTPLSGRPAMPPTLQRPGARARARAARALPTEDAIAIIGMSGRYPAGPHARGVLGEPARRARLHRRDPRRALAAGGLLPPRPRRGAGAGKSYSKWGGFLDGFARVRSAVLQHLAARGANIDPQERLFLQACWDVLEDAGYTRRAPAPTRIGGRVGVFAGDHQDRLRAVRPGAVEARRAQLHRAPRSARSRTGCRTS